MRASKLDQGISLSIFARNFSRRVVRFFMSRSSSAKLDWCISHLPAVT